MRRALCTVTRRGVGAARTQSGFEPAARSVAAGGAEEAPAGERRQPARTRDDGPSFHSTSAARRRDNQTFRVRPDSLWAPAAAALGGHEAAGGGANAGKRPAAESTQKVFEWCTEEFDDFEKGVIAPQHSADPWEQEKGGIGWMYSKPDPLDQAIKAKHRELAAEAAKRDDARAQRLLENGAAGGGDGMPPPPARGDGATADSGNAWNDDETRRKAAEAHRQKAALAAELVQADRDTFNLKRQFELSLHRVEQKQRLMRQHAEDSAVWAHDTHQKNVLSTADATEDTLRRWRAHVQEYTRHSYIANVMFVATTLYGLRWLWYYYAMDPNREYVSGVGLLGRYNNPQPALEARRRREEAAARQAELDAAEALEPAAAATAAPGVPSQ